MAFFGDFSPRVEVKAVKAHARASWFRDHTKVEETPRWFQDLWHEACTQIHQGRQDFPRLLADAIDRMPWKMRRAFDQSTMSCCALFLHGASCLCRGGMVPDKAVSFQAQAVSCCNQGQLAKGWPCGRAFQLGRIGGPFLLGGSCPSRRLEDKASVCPLIEAHQGLLGQGVWQSFGTEKGSSSRSNNNSLRAVGGLAECGLQQPGLESGSLTEREVETRARLADRRAGSDPLLGQAKQGGQLGQSRMKTDDTTRAAGDSAIGGFHLRQLIRHVQGKASQPMG